jgi:3-carboxy-cis,cis-muconate cycloisomerase
VKEGRSLLEVLSANAEVTAHLGAGQLERLLDPANYAGQAHAMVDAALASHQAFKS